MTIENRAVGLTEIKLSTGNTGAFSGYASVFNNVDSYGDAIAEGAFKATLSEWAKLGKLPPMLLQHGGMSLFGGGSPDALVPIGKWTDMAENSRGLKVEGQLIAMDTDLGKRVHAALKEGVLDGISIGFRTRKSVVSTNPKQGEPRRTLTEIELVEASLVTFPANSKARVTSVKSLTEHELREIEAALREKGFSWKQSVTIATVLKDYFPRDAGSELPTLPIREDQEAAQSATLAEVTTALRRLRGTFSASR